MLIDLVFLNLSCYDMRKPIDCRFQVSHRHPALAGNERRAFGVAMRFHERPHFIADGLLIIQVVQLEPANFRYQLAPRPDNFRLSVGKSVFGALWQPLDEDLITLDDLASELPGDSIPANGVSPGCFPRELPNGHRVLELQLRDQSIRSPCDCRFLPRG